MLLSAFGLAQPAAPREEKPAPAETPLPANADDSSAPDPSAGAGVSPPSPSPAPAETSELLVPTPPEWRLAYDEARTKLLTGEFADAAARFGKLEAKAVNRTDRALAHAQRTLAEDWAARNLTFVRRQDLADANLTSRALNRRATDELVSLYTNAVVYGIGSTVWLGVMTEPKTTAGAILPGFALTAGSVGTVLALDSGRGLHYGVAQAIVSGMWVGFEHGLVWTLWYNSRPLRDELDTKAHATFLWTFSTAGAALGGVLGETLGTTPGRSAWVGSTALWTGTIGGFATGGLLREDASTEALAVAGIGLTAGTAIGLMTASAVSPPVGRVRLIDLSGLVGGLGAAGLYAAFANEETSGQAVSGVTALGIAGGLAIGWVATAGMGRDSLRSDASTSEDAVDERSALRTIAKRTRPLLLPQTSGAILGAGGTF
jgi:hypothetical protein